MQTSDSQHLSDDELIYDPHRRQRYRFRRAGENLVADVWVEPGGNVPAHIHPALEERFEVISGRVQLKVDGRTQVAEAGERAVAPVGSKHSFANPGPDPAQLRVEVHPAGRLEDFLRDAAHGARERYYTRHGLPGSFRGAFWMAEFVERYRDTTMICSPPPFVQRLTLAPLRLFSRSKRKSH
jgi:quercetin dioxygenase-like cupin family protein